nr:PREDICTED: G patch domain-containing protein 1 isoform X1 [Latimeria chalumnae]|eukprot:XP_014348561.1 PREDICTED: G patch domain-containing protein 1 isoform X1 [Latimeria chalumnae]
MPRGIKGILSISLWREEQTKYEPVKKPVPIQDQTVKDEKGRYKCFHGAFSGGFSAGYFNTVGSKEGWTPSTFVSSRQQRAEKQVHRAEDFMDDEDFGEHGIAPKEIMATGDFASKAKDKIKEKARALAAVTAPIPGATILEDLIAPARVSIGVQLLRKMGWKEGQGVGPRVKRKPRRQRADPLVKIYGCALPTEESEGSEDEDDFQPENVTFAPKDVVPIDFTPKENVHGLGYSGLNPQRALLGDGGGHIGLFVMGSERAGNLLGDTQSSKGRKLGISGQAFGVGALEDEDADIYSADSLTQYDAVLGDQEPGDGLYGWTAPQEYRKKKGSEKAIGYIGKVLEGFILASKAPASDKVYPPPELPRDYRPVHYFRPVVTAGSTSSRITEALLASTGQLSADVTQKGRHQLNASERREILGETALQGPSSVFDLLSEQDRARIKETKQAAEQQQAAKISSQQGVTSQSQVSHSDETHRAWRAMLSGEPGTASSNFKPFAKNPEKQKRYEEYVRKLNQGQKDAVETSLDPNMTEWERGREREEFIHAAVLYKSANTTLSSRFTRAKDEDDADKVEVPRDQESDTTDKEAAVEMKMFGKLTRDKFEWHPDKLLCKRFNVPDPYPGAGIVGLPKVKRDKYSVFNFLTIPETPATGINESKAVSEKKSDGLVTNYASKSSETGRRSRWDVSAEEKQKKESIGRFIHLARTKAAKNQETEEISEGSENKSEQVNQAVSENTDQKEETRPPMDLFKAIFVSSSDEKSSSSSEDDDDDEGSDEEDEPQPTPVTENIEQMDASLASKKQSNIQNPSIPKQIDISKSPTLHHVDEADEKEEFGPKLPPSLPSATCLAAREALQPSTSVSSHRKEKTKKKHKAKKEHKHKEKKKKKHHKQRHKGKHRSKKDKESSSSAASDSSDNDVRGNAQSISSDKELLKRLKTLPTKKRSL